MTSDRVTWRAALAVYRFALRLAPRDFRDAYAGDVDAALREERQAPRYGGRTGGLRFWFDMARDLIAVLIRLRTPAARSPLVIDYPPRPPRRRIDMWRDDVASAVRVFRSRPALAGVAVLSLGLGLGGNALVFGLVDGLVLRPFPFPDSSRLVTVAVSFPRIDAGERFIEVLSPAEYLDIRAVPGLAHVSAFDLGNRNISGGDRPERLFTALVWGNPFASVAMAPLHGRAFDAAEMRPGGPAAAILSHRIWLSRFGGDPGLVGRTVRVNGQPTTVVGIMPPGLLLAGTDMWLPLTADPQDWARNQRQFAVLGRVAPGSSLHQVNAALAVLAARTTRDHASAMPEYQDWRLTALPFDRAVTREQRPAGLLLLATAVIVLLIACVNLANVWLARAADRQREVAIRVALGASRSTIIRSLLVETFTVSLAGVLVGLLLAWLGLQAAQAWIPLQVRSVGFEIGFSWRVLGYTLALAGLAGFAIGIVPALQGSMVRPDATLREHSGALSGPRRSLRLRHGLIVTEVALATILLAGAGLLLRSYTWIRSVDPGFAHDRILTMRLTLPPQKYQGDQIRVFFDDLIARVRALPGVEAGAAASQFPPFQSFTTRVRAEGAVGSGPGELPTASLTLTTPGFHEVFGIPLQAGRFLEARDRRGAPGVVVVNRAFARRHFGNHSPIGRRIALSGGADEPDWIEVVGVVGDVRSRGVTAAVTPEVFVPVQQFSDVWNQLFLVIRTTGEPRSVLSAVRDQVRAIDPEQPVYAIQTLQEAFDAARLQPRVSSTLMVWFAGFALVIAAIGLYGVLSYAVSTRTREIGIRVALGADRGRILRSVVGQAARLVGAGTLVGLLAVVSLAPLLRDLVHGVSARDPLTLALVAAVLGVIALLAAVVPARRATAVDPVLALRSE